MGMEQVGTGKDAAGVGVPPQIIGCSTLPGVTQHRCCLLHAWGCSSRILREKEIACTVWGFTEHPSPAAALLGWGEALKSPSPDQLGQLRPAPSPGRRTPAYACLSAGHEAPMGAAPKEAKVPWGDASLSRRACGAESQASAAAHQQGAGGGRRRVAHCGMHLRAGSGGPASISAGCA